MTYGIAATQSAMRNHDTGYCLHVTERQPVAARRDEK